MGKSTTKQQDGPIIKRAIKKPAKDMSDFDKHVFKDTLKQHDDQINKLKKELDENLSELYQEMIKMRDRVNKAMERLGLGGM